MSREGCGRVGIFRETLLPNCYTLECNYHSGKRINYIPPKFNKAKGEIMQETPLTDCNSRIYCDSKKVFT